MPEQGLLKIQRANEACQPLSAGYFPRPNLRLQALLVFKDIVLVRSQSSTVLSGPAAYCCSTDCQQHVRTGSSQEQRFAT